MYSQSDPMCSSSDLYECPVHPILPLLHRKQEFFEKLEFFVQAATMLWNEVELMCRNQTHLLNIGTYLQYIQAL